MYRRLIAIIFILSIFVTGCAQNEERTKVPTATSPIMDRATVEADDISEYSKEPYIVVNSNQPYFTDNERSQGAFARYAALDDLGRCRGAFARVSRDTLPTEERGAIGQVRPSGWHTVKYDFLPDRYLYNRCHLIAYELTGENANERNLITGTRYMNVEGMLPFENKVHDYVSTSGDTVLYRVTPIFAGDDLVARGVLIEAESSAENGLSFCVFCYNVQPGVEIDYSDGSSFASENAEDYYREAADPASDSDGEWLFDYESNGELGIEIPDDVTYVFNRNSHKFHKPDCDSVGDMKPKNTEYFKGSREEAIEEGYSPCGRCKP